MKKEYVALIVALICFFILLKSLKGLEKRIAEEMRRIHEPTLCEKVYGYSCTSPEEEF